jgi:hypothetical protein
MGMDPLSGECFEAVYWDRNAAKAPFSDDEVDSMTIHMLLEGIDFIPSNICTNISELYS